MSIIDNVKALWTVKKAVDGIKEAKVKNGINTSEFWFAVGSQIVPVVLALWGFIPQDIMVQVMAISGILAGVYAVVRAIVKRTVSKVDDAVFNRIVAIIKPIADKIGVAIEPIEETK